MVCEWACIIGDLQLLGQGKMIIAKLGGESREVWNSNETRKCYESS